MSFPHLPLSRTIPAKTEKQIKTVKNTFELVYIEINTVCLRLLIVLTLNAEI